MQFCLEIRYIFVIDFLVFYYFGVVVLGRGVVLRKEVGGRLGRQSWGLRVATPRFSGRELFLYPNYFCIL